VARKAEFIFVGDAQSVIRAAKQTSAATEKAGKSVDSVHVRMRRSFAGLTASAAKMSSGIIAAYASIEGAKKAVSTTEDLAKSTLTLHKSFGLSIKSASEWASVAKARGADGKSLVMGFKALATQTRNARQGVDAQSQAVDNLRKKQDLALQQALATGKSTADVTKLKQQQSLALDTLTSKVTGNAKTFAQLGISQVQLRKHGDDLNWVLHAVSDGLGKLPAGTDKAAIQAKLFGRTWTAVSPLIRSGSKAMDEQLAVAEKYGATLNGHSIKSIEGLVKAQREARLASMGLQVTVGTSLIPTITKGISAFAAFVNQIRNGGGGFAKFRADVKAAATEVKTDITALVAVIGPVVTKLIAGFKSLPGPVKIAVGVIAGLGLVLAATSPLGVALVAFAAIAVLIKRNWGTIGPVIQSVRNAVSGWVNRAKPDLEVLRKAFNDVATVVKTVLAVAFNFALAVAKRAWPGIKAAVQGALQVIKGVVNVFLGILHGDWARVWGGLKGIVSGVLKGAWGAIRAATAPGREAIAYVVNQALKRASDFAGKFLSIGGDLISGLINGIKDKAGDLINAIKNFVTDKIPKFVKKALGIASPSTVFYDIGQWVAKGLADGIADGKDTLTAAIKAGMLFPLDAAIANLNAQKDKLQQAFDLADSTRQRADLVTAIATAKRGKLKSVGKGSASLAGLSASGGGSVARSALAVAQRMGASPKQRLALIEAGIVESGLKNLSYGDRDSVGFLQQRPSQGWHGLRNVPAAAREFLQHAMGVNSRSLTAGQLAQRVQASAFPARYDAVKSQALSVIAGLGGGGSGGGSSKGGKKRLVVDPGAVRDAIKALHDFDRERARTNQMAKLDLKIKGIEALKQFKDAIAGVRSQLHDLASQAASVWRTQQEAAIQGGDLAQQLAGLKATDAAQQDAQQTAQLQQALSDAIAAGDVKAQKDAQDAIDAYARSKQEDAIQAQIDAQIAGLDTQEQNYQATLDNQLAALADNLQNGTIMYKQFAQDVNDILSAVGLSYQGSPDEEASIANIPAGSGGKAGPLRMVNQFQRNARPRKKRAAGGSVHPGIYRVGELGPEDLTITGSRSGMVTQASQSNQGGGGNVIMTGPVSMGSRRHAEALANRLAFRLRFG
jgi:hypothetical protein